MKLIVQDIYKYEVIAQALSNKTRLKIINLLSTGEYNINEISKELNMPVPTVTVNVQKLEESGIIQCHSKSGKHGKQKICFLKYDQILLNINEAIYEEPDLKNDMVKDNNDSYSEIISETINIPLGEFIDYKVNVDCGLASLSEYIGGTINNSNLFSSPERKNARIIWFNDGYLTYQLDIDSSEYVFESLSISFEACSEHLFFNKNWPSDITVWLNDYELGTHTSEGNFNSSRNINPSWWPTEKSQAGELICFEIDQDATYINGNIIKSLKISDILNDNNDITIKIGIKEDAVNSRGLIIFGKSYGFYDQDIVLTINYRKNI